MKKALKTMKKPYIAVICFAAIPIIYFYYNPFDTTHKSLIHLDYVNCSSFDFNPVTWTLYRKSPSPNKTESSRCQRFYKSLIEAKAVKRVIYPNGTAENNGCTKHSSMCKESPNWDYRLNIRINTPPCCLEKMKEVFRIVTTDLQKHNISNIIFGGAMLGYARNKQFVPYDNDLDVWMDGKYWDTPLFEKIRQKWMTVDGMDTGYKDDGGKLWVLYSKENGNGLDIWPWYPKGSKVYIAKDREIPKYDVPKELIFPLKPAYFSGISTHVPGNPTGYCEWQYGKNWRTEKKCTKVERRKCIV